MEIRESISLLQSVRAKMGTLGIQWVDRVEMERRAEDENELSLASSKNQSETTLEDHQHFLSQG